MFSIYNYEDPALYLRDSWEEKRKTNKKFSIRSWAKSMGLNYHNALHEIVKGKRMVPKAYVPALIKSLHLDVDEGLYLDSMIDLQRAKSLDEKEIYAKRLQSISPKPKIGFTEVETFRSLKDPLHLIITELSDLKGFKNDPAWIKNRLGFTRSIHEIEEAIDRLIALKLMRENEKGELVKVNRHTYSKSDVVDAGLQEYHKGVMELAKKAISKQDVKNREYNGYAINIDKRKMDKAKKMIRKFMNDFALEMEATPHTGTDTYQLNLQFFNLTDKIDN